MAGADTPSWRKALRRRLLAVAAVVPVLILGVSASSAWAACEGDAPAPQEPDSGMAGWLVKPVKVDVEVNSEADLVRILDAQPDPFSDDGVGLVETYGYGYNWGTYDLGCGPDAVRDPISVAFTSIGNFVFDAGLTMGAAAETAQSFVLNSPLKFLDGTVSDTQSAVLNTIWKVWFPITLMAVGIYLLARARRAQFSQTAQTTLLVVTVLAASVYLLNWPIKAMTFTDTAVSEGIQLAMKPFGNETLEEQMARTIYYPAWVRGELGTDTSTVALQDGQELFKAQHYSWTEMALIDELSPTMRDILIESKEEDFEEIAAEIQDNYPTAYEHLVGHSGENRLGTAFLVLPFSAASALFVCICMALVLLALMIIRGFILAFPIVGLIGAHPLGRPALSRLWDLLTAAVWNVIKFAFVIGLFLVIAGALLSADISALAKIFFLIVLTVAVFAIARPFRAVKTMIPGADADKSYLLSGWRRMRGRHPDDPNRTDEEREQERISTDSRPGQERSPQRPPAEEESLPPLAPTMAQAPTAPPTASGAGQPIRHDADDHTASTMPPSDYGTSPGAPGAPTPAGASGSVPWPGEVGAPGGTTLNGASGTNGNGVGSVFASGTYAPRLTVDQIDSRELNGNGHRPTAPGRHARRAIPPEESEPRQLGELPAASKPAPDPSMPPPGRRLAIEGEAVEPVYRRGYDTAPEPVADIPMSDPVIDEDGKQVYVIYQRAPELRGLR